MADGFESSLQKMLQVQTMQAYMASFQRIKEQQQMEASRRGHKPHLSTDVHQLRIQHRINAIQMSAQHNAAQMRFSTTASHKIDASKASLETLKRISLKDLRLEKAMKGGYLILRTLEPAFKIIGITTVVEDHEGNAVLFSVYNITEDLNPNLSDILPVGTIFILKEPYIKISAANESMVRCDCPSDMVVVYKGHALFELVKGIKWRNGIDPQMYVDPVFSHPTPKTALEFKERGNALFKDRKYEYATRSYLLALQELAGLSNVGNLEKIVLLNVSAAYLQRGFFESSLEFANKVLKIDPGNRKAVDRAGRCCYKLRKYENAMQYFEECHIRYPEDEDAKKELQNTKDRLMEKAEGKFNIYKMFLTRAFKARQKIDCADYAGAVEVVEIPGKGRGIVATSDIEPGTLLVASKALVYDWAPENEFRLQVNHDSTADIGSSNVVIAQLVQLIAKNPNTFGPIVYDFFDGNHLVKDGSAKLFCNPETREEPIVDVERIKGILTTNSFCGMYLKPQLSRCIKIEQMYDGENGGGLFTLPSYFNHSCIPNAIWHIYNDVMIVSAINHIKVKEEVFLPYFSWELKFSERQSMCAKRGFQCDCRLCLQDSNVSKNIASKREEICSKYEKMLNKIDATARISHGVIRRTQSLVNELAYTYNSEEIQLDATLLYMYTFLARAYSFDAGSSQWQYDKAIECHHNILKLFGFDPHVMLESIEKGNNLIALNAFLTEQVIRAISNLVFIYNYAGQIDVRNKWIQALHILENIHSGGDVNVLKLQYDYIKNLL